MSLRKWLAFGTGVGIEITGDDLRVMVVRVRPAGPQILGAHVIEKFRERPAAEWGAEYSGFLASHNAAHLAATVILPRREVIVRVVSLPGVASKEMEAALSLQVDTLHPYPEGDASWTWARLGNTSSVLVGIARQAYTGRQLELLTEAGVKVASFTFSTAAIHSALRLTHEPPADGILGLTETPSGVEVYGETPARPVYSATLSEPWERAAALAAAELRAPQSVVAKDLRELLPAPKSHLEQFTSSTTITYAAAITAACPRLSLAANLLPASMRQQSSRLIYVPTFVLGSLLVLGMAALGFYSRYEDQKYLDALNSEIKTLEPRARRLDQFDKRTEQARARIRLLDSFQARTKADLDAVKEVTRLVPPPAWLNTLELNRTNLTIAGEADQATGLLKALDSSPQFQASEFIIPISRIGQVEAFRIRAAREGVQQ